MVLKDISFKKKLTKSFDKSILQGAGIAFIVKVLGAGASFGLQVALARLLSLEDYGSYTYIMAWIGMASGFTSLGFTTSIIRFIPEYLKKEEYAKLKGVIKSSILVTICCSLLFGAVGLAVISVLADTGYSLTTNLYAVGILVGLAMIRLFGSLEKGKKRMFMAHAPSQLFKHVFIGSGILTLWAIKEKIDVQTTVFITFMSIVILVIWHLFTINDELPSKIFKGESTYSIKEWLKISLPLLLISGFLMILNRTDIIMLGILSTKAQVGIYNVAYKVATLTSFILMAVNAIAAPTISELYHEGKMEELQNFAKKIAHLIFWPTLVLSVVLVISASFILSLFGKEFIDGDSLLIILLVGQLVNACVGSVGYYLNMTGHERDSAKVFGTAALVNIILNPLGIYFYGAVGAAVVTTFTTSMWNIWLYFLVRKKVGIRSTLI